jgi:hypothetical protein
METQEWVKWGAAGIVALMSLIQISPIKINPWTAIGRWIGRAINGELIEKVSNLEKQLEIVEAKHDESEAKSARVRILRFGDELYQGKLHSKEHFEDILADITEYDTYCREHPNFKNERTKVTESVILSQYRKCTEEHSFLE